MGWRMAEEVFRRDGVKRDGSMNDFEPWAIWRMHLDDFVTVNKLDISCQDPRFAEGHFAYRDRSKPPY